MCNSVFACERTVGDIPLKHLSLLYFSRFPVKAPAAKGSLAVPGVTAPKRRADERRRSGGSRAVACGGGDSEHPRGAAQESTAMIKGFVRMPHGGAMGSSIGSHRSIFPPGTEVAELCKDGLADAGEMRDE